MIGLRGFIRSAVAASNRSKREEEKARRVLERASTKVDAIEEQINSEIERDSGKVKLFEEKVRVKPVSFGGLKYHVADRKFSFKPIGDDSGMLRWSGKVEFSFDQAIWDGELRVDSQLYEPADVCVNRYGVYIAFRVLCVGEGKSTKLLYKSDPAKNRMYLCSDGRNYQALEGTLDSPDIDGIAVVCFPLPNSDSPIGQVLAQTENGVKTVIELKLTEGLNSLANASESASAKFR